jgi:hypothetical protein
VRFFFKRALVWDIGKRVVVVWGCILEGLLAPFWAIMIIPCRFAKLGNTLFLLAGYKDISLRINTPHGGHTLSFCALVMKSSFW